MTDNVVAFPKDREPQVMTTQQDGANTVSAEAVFEGAMEAGVSNMVMVGWTAEGSLYCAATSQHLPDVAFMLQSCLASIYGKGA